MRAKKIQYNQDASDNFKSGETLYIRDAGGTVVKIIDKAYESNDPQPTDIRWETPIYGASRLGTRYATWSSAIPECYPAGNDGDVIIMYCPPSPGGGSLVSIKSIYEHSDHLSNIRATYYRDNQTGNLAINSTQDYYPFGWTMPGRNDQNGERYRYGYQGEFAEMDEETGWNSFELRSYDPRVARWMTIDPEYQHYSPYLAMGNNPVNRIDPNGGTDGVPEYAQGTLRASSSAALAQHSNSSISTGGNYLGASLTWQWMVRDFYYRPNVQSLQKYYGASYQTRMFASQMRNTFTLKAWSMLTPEIKALSQTAKNFKLNPEGNFAKINKGWMLRSRVGGVVGIALIGYGAKQSYDYIQAAPNQKNAMIHETATWAGSFVGAWIGAKVGTTAGAIGGGTIGSVVPVAGTAAGAGLGSIIGGIVGAISGGFGGGYAGSKISENNGYTGYETPNRLHRFKP